MKIAWFSPLPPSTSGIAAYSAELLPLLATHGHVIDVYTEENARDFVWRQRRGPYDLTVFHMGNASCHDYVWAYLFRYPGMVVLHDAQLHQARALFLTRRWKPRRTDYLAEFRANHPEAPPDAGELVAAGLGGSLYQHWPLIRLVIESARLTVVHNQRLLDLLRQKYPTANLAAIEMGVSDPLQGTESRARGRKEVLAAHDIPEGTVLLAAFGGVTPEKRIGPIIRALSAIADRHPRLHLMLVGSAAEHFDALDEAERGGVSDRVHLTGYVPDDELPAYLGAADICACLRWPTNRETSASWLRCMAAGRTTIITDLAHTGDIPTVDARGWRVLDTQTPARPPVAVSIDILDEEHSLQLALERLATDEGFRATLGRAARRWWDAHHQLETMADAYGHVLARAAALPAADIDLPPHLRDEASHLPQELTREFGVAARLADIFPA